MRLLSRKEGRRRVRTDQASDADSYAAENTNTNTKPKELNTNTTAQRPPKPPEVQMSRENIYFCCFAMHRQLLHAFFNTFPPQVIGRQMKQISWQCKRLLCICSCKSQVFVFPSWSVDWGPAGSSGHCLGLQPYCRPPQGHSLYL